MKNCLESDDFSHCLQWMDVEGSCSLVAFNKAVKKTIY